MQPPGSGVRGATGRRLYFSAGERVVFAETKEPALSEAARRLFPAYEVPQPKLVDADHVSVTVTRKRGEHVIISPDAPPVSCRSRMDALVALEFALSRTLAASFSDHVHLHASGAVVDGRAVIALGRSGAGKSSLAASMLARGFRTLGDDTVFLNSRCFVEPFKRLMKLSTEVLEELGVAPESTIHWDREWPEAWLDPVDGPGWAEEAPVAVIVLAQHDPAASMSLEPVTSSDALNALLHSVMISGMPAGTGFDRLLHVAESAKTFWLRFRSSVEAAELLSSMPNE